jgi:hypothetical protein
MNATKRANPPPPPVLPPAALWSAAPAVSGETATASNATIARPAAAANTRTRDLGSRATGTVLSHRNSGGAPGATRFGTGRGRGGGAIVRIGAGGAAR